MNTINICYVIYTHLLASAVRSQPQSQSRSLGLRLGLGLDPFGLSLGL